MGRHKKVENVEVEDETKVEQEESVDTSAYNCLSCKGEGLVLKGTSYKVCETCLGKGKV